jgi:REP element-mobilizing transposase RayT
MIRFNSAQHNRQSIRLKGYDYSREGAYFITICAHDRACLFGKVTKGAMRANLFGEVVAEEWLRTSHLRSHVITDTYVLMPNHLHGVLVITGRGTLQRAPTEKHQNIERFGKPSADSIPTMIRLFKSAVTKRINVMRNTPGFPVWQRNYYEHIIRDEDELNSIREYIQMNPQQWDNDQENPY